MTATTALAAAALAATLASGAGAAPPSPAGADPAPVAGGVDGSAGHVPFVLPPAPPAPESAPARLTVAGIKFKAPQTRMTEARVSWALGRHLSVQLSYERTAYAPTMSRDHDDGILTGVKLGF